MTRHKPFSRTEMKILIYNKVKNGMSYEKAKKEVSKEIASLIENSKKEKKVDEKTKCDNFQKDFKKMKDGK
jgi:ribosomal protein L22